MQDDEKPALSKAHLWELNARNSKLLTLRQEAVIRELESEVVKGDARERSEKLLQSADELKSKFRKEQATLARRLKELGDEYGVDFSECSYDPETGAILFV